MTDNQLAQALLNALNQPGVSVPESVCQAALRLQDRLGRSAVKGRILELIWEALQHSATGHGDAPFLLVRGMCHEQAKIVLSPELFEQLCAEAKIADGAGAEASEQLLSRFMS